MIKLIYTLKRFVTKSFLVICKEKAAEFLSLEEIFAVILIFRHCKYLSARTRFIHFWGAKLCFQIKLTVCKFGQIFHHVFVQNLFMKTIILIIQNVRKFTNIRR